MKKLHLDPDALTVISFPTVAEPEAVRGTVAAHEGTALGQATCGASCNTSCAGGGHCTCYPA
jgi:hypothetical protein